MALITLNIAAGKFDPIDDKILQGEPQIIVNLDTMYYKTDEPALIEHEISRWECLGSKTFHCNVDALEFMERTRIIFDRICIYRFLEHVSFTNVMYFIYLVSMVTHRDSIVDVIVPNYETLANMILQEDVTTKEFESDNILLTTELLNEPSCPHASIWTPDRVYHFWEMEGRFKVKHVIHNYKFDGREIYMRFKAERL